MKFKNNIVLFLSCVCLHACTKDIGKNPDLAPVSSLSACDTVKFAAHILPIINNNCLYCHGGLGPGNGNFTNYSGIKQKVDNGSFKARVVDLLPTPMPQAGALPAQQIALIKCWLEKGAPNN